MTQDNSSLRIGVAPVCLGVLLALSSTAIARQGGTEYQGDGYIRSLGPTGSDVWIELFDSDGDGVHELARLDGQGVLEIHESFFENDWRFSIPDLTACATVRGGVDRLFGVQEGVLVEISRSNPLGWSASAAGFGGLPPIDDLRGSSRPGGNTLLLIDTDRTHVTVLNFSSGWRLTQQYQVPSGGGLVHDAAVLDWNADGRDDLAVIDDAGLRIIGSQGVLLYSVLAPTTRAFLEVLPGADTQFGKDLLLYHHLATGTNIGILQACNAFHTEQVYVDPLQLAGLEVANFDSHPGDELILACGNARWAVIVTQFPVGLESDPFLGIDYSAENYIGFGDDSPFVPTHGPAVTSADLDGDGDDDLVFSDDLGRGLVIASSQFNADDRRAFPEIEYATGAGMVSVAYDSETGQALTVQYAQTLKVPLESDGIEVKVWFQANAEVEAPFVSVQPTASQISFLEPGLKSVVVETAVQQAGAGIYYFSFRPTLSLSGAGRYPAWIGAWSLDSSVRAELQSTRGTIYPWAQAAASAPPGTENLEGAEGTTRRPIVIPPIGGPPN